MSRVNKPWFWEAKKAWYVKINGKRTRLDKDREEAFRKFHALKAKKPVVVESSDLLIAILDKFLDWNEKNRAAGTYRFYHEHCQHFHDYLKAEKLTDIEAEEIKPWQVEEYLDTVTAGRKNGACQTIKRVYSWAKKKGHINSNPVEGVDKPPCGRRDNLIPLRDYKKMLKLSSDDNFRDLLEFCWETVLPSTGSLEA